jgi:F0F1-type ATP synthase assembly protein I
LLERPSPPVEPPKGRRAVGWSGALRDVAPYVSIGTTLAVTVLAGLGGGYWLDAQLGTAPWLLLAGGVIGLGAALFHFFRTVASLNR